MNREVCLQASTEDVMSLCLTTVPLVKLAIDWWCVNCWAIYGKHQDDSFSGFVSRTQRSTLTARTARKSGICARVPCTVFNVMGCLVLLHPLVARSPLQWDKSTRCIPFSVSDTALNVREQTASNKLVLLLPNAIVANQFRGFLWKSKVKSMFFS